MFERGEKRERRVGVKGKGTEKNGRIGGGGRVGGNKKGGGGEKMTNIVCSLLLSPSTP